MRGGGSCLRGRSRRGAVGVGRRSASAALLPWEGVDSKACWRGGEFAGKTRGASRQGDAPEDPLRSQSGSARRLPNRALRGRRALTHIPPKAAAQQSRSLEEGPTDRAGRPRGGSRAAFPWPGSEGIRSSPRSLAVCPHTAPHTPGWASQQSTSAGAKPAQWDPDVPPLHVCGAKAGQEAPGLS